MTPSDRTEEQRERNEQFSYDEYRAAMHAPVNFTDEEGGYDPDEWKHETYYERTVDVWDGREKMA